MIFDSKKIRDELDMTQQDFANLIGVSVSTIRHWDNHETAVSPMIQPRILAVMRSLGFDERIEFEDIDENTVYGTTD